MIKPRHHVVDTGDVWVQPGGTNGLLDAGGALLAPRPVVTESIGASDQNVHQLPGIEALVPHQVDPGNICVPAASVPAAAPVID